MPLRHVVIFSFKPTSTEAAVGQVVKHFLSLKEAVPQLIDMEFGHNISPENHHQGFTHCFLLTFSSLNKLEEYQSHPAHLAFQEVLRPHIDRVFVVDYQA